MSLQSTKKSLTSDNKRQLPEFKKVVRPKVKQTVLDIHRIGIQPREFTKGSITRELHSCGASALICLSILRSKEPM